MTSKKQNILNKSSHVGFVESQSNYELYIIYTMLEADDILELIYSYSHDILEMGPIRNDLNRDSNGNYYPSNRRIIILSKDLFKRLEDKGLSKKNRYNFLIKPYQFRDDNFSPSDSVNHLYFPSGSKDGNMIDRLGKKLDFITKMGLLKENTWTIHNEGVVIFDETVDDKSRTIVKTILDDPEDFRVSWCKKKLFNKLKQKA